MTYDNRVVLDSIGEHGIRLITNETRIPKWLVAEFNTHRMISRNSASSRAIPTKKIIEQVMTDPVIPVTWMARNTGMSANKLLNKYDAWECERKWLTTRDLVVRQVESMLDIGDGVDKQRINRLLEPWMWTVIVNTASDWQNFYTLRNNNGAQPEFHHVADIMQQQHTLSTPIHAEWHMPYMNELTQEEKVDIQELLLTLDEEEYTVKAIISSTYCGRVSYFKQGIVQDAANDYSRGLSFADNRHWSPLEHVANADTRIRIRWCDERKTYVKDFIRHGNFYGWKQLRKFFKGESGQELTGTPVYGIYFDEHTNV